jgi:manganese/iron transport system permease protein
MASMDLILDPFRPLFMQRAALEILLLAVPAGVLGAWIVVRRMAFLTHSIGHATYPALVVAILAGVGTLAPAIGSAAAAAVLLVWLERRRALRGGVAVAITLSTALALGSVLVSRSDDPGVRANGLLFGSLLALTDADVWGSAVVGVLTLAAVGALWRPLVAQTFDREVAGRGRAGVMIETGLVILLAIAVAISIRAVGSLLVAGFFLAPAATARLVTKRLAHMMALGVAMAGVCGLVGLWVAYRIDGPPGACIAAVSAVTWACAAILVTLRRQRLMRIIPT